MSTYVWIFFDVTNGRGTTRTSVQEPWKKNIGTLEVVFGKILSRCNRKMFSKILLSNLNVAIFALMWRIFGFQWITDVIVNSIYSVVWVWRKCSQSHESSQGTVNGVIYWEARPRAHFFSPKDAPTDMPAPPVMVLLMLTRIASNPRCVHFCPSLFIIVQKVQLCITKYTIRTPLTQKAEVVFRINCL